jgi:hypothetical protein
MSSEHARSRIGIDNDLYVFRDYSCTFGAPLQRANFGNLPTEMPLALMCIGSGALFISHYYPIQISLKPKQHFTVICRSYSCYRNWKVGIFFPKFYNSGTIHLSSKLL